jgi:hypothetical protein
VIDAPMEERIDEREQVDTFFKVIMNCPKIKKIKIEFFPSVNVNNLRDIILPYSLD